MRRRKREKKKRHGQRKTGHLAENNWQAATTCEQRYSSRAVRTRQTNKTKKDDKTHQKKGRNQSASRCSLDQDAKRKSIHFLVDTPQQQYEAFFPLFNIFDQQFRLLLLKVSSRRIRKEIHLPPLPPFPITLTNIERVCEEFDPESCQPFVSSLSLSDAHPFHHIFNGVSYDPDSTPPTTHSLNSLLCQPEIID